MGKHGAFVRPRKRALYTRVITGLGGIRVSREEALKKSILATRILLATDGSDEAELAALRAVESAQSTGSELHVVHVGLVAKLLTSDPATRTYDRKLYKRVEEVSRELLRKLS